MSNKQAGRWLLQLMREKTLDLQSNEPAFEMFKEFGFAYRQVGYWSEGGDLFGGGGQTRGGPVYRVYAYIDGNMAQWDKSYRPEPGSEEGETCK